MTLVKGIKGDECSCTRYCDCADAEPCGCPTMETDPHCRWCCMHLTDEQIKKWTQDGSLFGPQARIGRISR
jgi:hypothetical protein